jgi:hypothetical protein
MSAVPDQHAPSWSGAQVAGSDWSRRLRALGAVLTFQTRRRGPATAVTPHIVHLDHCASVARAFDSPATGAVA